MEWVLLLTYETVSLMASKSEFSQHEQFVFVHVPHQGPFLLTADFKCQSLYSNQMKLNWAGLENELGIHSIKNIIHSKGSHIQARGWKRKSMLRSCNLTSLTLPSSSRPRSNVKPVTLTLETLPHSLISVDSADYTLVVIFCKILMYNVFCGWIYIFIIYIKEFHNLILWQWCYHMIFIVCESFLNMNDSLTEPPRNERNPLKPAAIPESFLCVIDI